METPTGAKRSQQESLADVFDEEHSKRKRKCHQLRCFPPEQTVPARHAQTTPSRFSDVSYLISSDQPMDSPPLSPTAKPMKAPTSFPCPESNAVLPDTQSAWHPDTAEQNSRLPWRDGVVEWEGMELQRKPSSEKLLRKQRVWQDEPGSLRLLRALQSSHTHQYSAPHVAADYHGSDGANHCVVSPHDTINDGNSFIDLHPETGFDTGNVSTHVLSDQTYLVGQTRDVLRDLPSVEHAWQIHDLHCPGESPAWSHQIYNGRPGTDFLGDGGASTDGWTNHP